MDTIEQQAKEFLGSLSDKQLSDIKSAFNEAVNTLIHREQEKLDKIQQDLSDIKKQERELWDKQKDMEYSPEKTEIMNKRMALYSLIKIREFQIIHQINIVTAISNGGSIAQITDQFDNIHTSIPDFRNLKTENILFDEENILIIPKPEYIPVINEKIFESKGYIFDAIRISNDSYILSANEYKEGYSAEVTAEYMQPFILVTLDQLVLSMDYYYKKAKALAIQDAKEKTLRQEQYYDSLPAEKREKHFAQKDFYTTLPVNIKKKITQSEWEALDLSEKEKLFKPFKKYGSKRLVSKLEDNQMWVSFHDLYQRFVNKNAWPVNKDGELLVGKKAHGYNTFGNPETFKYWYWFQDMMNFKIKDIEIHRQDLSEIRKEAIETSFGERNTDITLKQEYGILVKRQSGEKINPAEIEQIREAWIDIQKAFGGLKDIADKINLKISHTANKHIFASKAIGVFIADMGTIGVSSRYGDVQFKLTLAHESGHMIDSYIGGLHGKRYATDDYEGSAGVLAFAFRNNMNKPKGEQSKYVNSTKECFARAFEQYYGMTILGEGALLSHSYKELDRTEPIYKTDDFVNKEKFETIIKPLVEKFLEENKEILKHINFEDMKTMIKTPDNLSQTIIEATEKLESNKETMKNHVAAIVKVGENEYNFFFPMAGEYNIGDKQKETEFEIVDIITIGETEPEQILLYHAKTSGNKYEIKVSQHENKNGIYYNLLELKNGNPQASVSRNQKDEMIKYLNGILENSEKIDGIKYYPVFDILTTTGTETQKSGNQLKDTINNLLILYKKNENKVIAKEIETTMYLYFRDIVSENPEEIRYIFQISEELPAKNKFNFSLASEDSEEMQKFIHNANEKGLSLWQLIPDEYKNITNISKIQWMPEPENEGLKKIVSPYVATDDLRPNMLGVHFEETGITATDAHRMIFLPAKVVRQGNYCMTRQCWNYEAQVKESNYPNYKAVIPYDFSYTIDIYPEVLIEFLNTVEKAELINNTTEIVAFRFGDNMIGFKLSFLRTAMKTMLQLGYREITIGLNDISRPVIFIGKGNLHEYNKNQFNVPFVLLMPMLLQYAGSVSNLIDLIYFNLDNQCVITFGKQEDCLEPIQREKVKFQKATEKAEKLASDLATEKEKIDERKRAELKKEKERSKNAVKKLKTEFEPEPQPEQDKQKYIDKIEVYREMLSETKNKKEKQKYLDKIDVYEEMITEI